MIMTKVPNWPRPHNYAGSFAMGMESAVANSSTIIPIITYDEGLGVISAYESNPTNSSFTEVSSDHCYPTSRVNKIFMEVVFSMSKEALETDKVHTIRFNTMKIHTAFNETLQAVDEKSTLTLNDILELDFETTDRQMYPLWNDIDLKDGKANAMLDLPAETPGLDTDLEIEGVAFSESVYYDCLHYYTNAKKLLTVQDGLQWHQLNKTHPTKILRISQASNTKYMNPYTFLGLMINLPPGVATNQIGKPSDTTDVNHLEVSYRYRYNEWNFEFNHSQQ